MQAGGDENAAKEAGLQAGQMFENYHNDKQWRLNSHNRKDNEPIQPFRPAEVRVRVLSRKSGMNLKPFLLRPENCCLTVDTRNSPN